MKMARTQSKTAIVFAFCFNAILWQVSGSATVVPPSSASPAANPCATITCTSPRMCQVDQKTNQPTCVCPSICYLIYKPVCGSNGKTYSNDCKMNADACQSNSTITAIFNGTCEDNPSSQDKTALTGSNPCATVRCREGSSCQVDQANTAICACSDMCTMEYRPVCGSDGKTYPNRCGLYTASCKSGYNTTLVREGDCAQAQASSPCDTVRCREGSFCQVDQTNRAICACSEICTDDYNPVCGTDGKTYPNRCELYAASCKSGYNTTLAREGDCASAQASSPCDTVRCREGSSCQVDQTNTAICACSGICTREYNPVCGSDGKTYPNRCLLYAASCKSGYNTTLAREGDCAQTQAQGQVTDRCAAVSCGQGAQCQVNDMNATTCVCREACTKILDQVCGSDGKTYGNQCELDKAACKSGTSISVANQGECGTASNPCATVRCREGSYCQVDQTNTAICACSEICTREYNPVCGSDGKTYPNRCLLYTASCKTGYNTTLVREGDCAQAQASSPCDTVRCREGSSCQVDQTNRAICACSEICTREYNPVCGSDGKTYPNRCLLYAASCKSGYNTTLTREGDCAQAQASNPCDTVRCMEGSYCQVDQINATKCACYDVCTADFRPVCGSDGKTYPNRCGLFTTSCKSGYKTTLAYEGECTQGQVTDRCAAVSCGQGAQCQVNSMNETTCVCKEACTRISAQVCGSDGKTYANQCELDKAACKSGTRISVANQGECGQATNPCAAVLCPEGARCQVNAVNEGQCVCNEVCKEDYNPVCGSDGKTYSNPCSLGVERCKNNQKLTVACQGTCQKSGRRLRCRGGDI